MTKHRLLVAGVGLLGGLAIGAIAPGMLAQSAQRAAALSDKPDTPFKLATFEAAGKTRVGLVLEPRVLDIVAANDSLTRAQRLPVVRMPSEMRELIENYDRVKTRLYQIANYYKTAEVDSTVGIPLSAVSVKAPIKYPYNLLAAAANYRSHANEMFGRDDRTPIAVNQIDPDKVDPVMFAKSPRSCIIDPGEPFFIPAGRNIDWEGELAIVIGKPSFNITEAQAHDHVFGYSAMFDVSDRGGTGRPLSAQFQAPNWFAGKSRDRGAPFGPYIVPKEFFKYPEAVRIVTKVNGVTKQDGTTKDMIWDEAHLVRYLSSILTLYPGDVISSGTPDGVGTARRPPEYLKPGDTVTIEIEGIGTLTTPMQAAK